jgi:hypothetical protein
VSSSILRTCPYCHQHWPKGPDHDLRGFGWLDPLPRGISISNGDLALHDGTHGRDRFLFLETKMKWEPTMQTGQRWLLGALAKQAGWVVRVLRGTLDNFTIHRVNSSGEEADGITGHAGELRSRIAGFLQGESWRDPSGTLVKHSPGNHVCGWGQVGGHWVCVQDYYAAGFAPDTGCGAEWVQP